MKQLARPHRQPRVVHALVVEMAVHAIEPTGHPTATRFEERKLEPRMAIANAAHDQAGRRCHHLERMRHAMTYRSAGGEAIHCERYLSAFGTAVDSDRKPDIFGFPPERLVVRIVKHPSV